MSREPFTLQDTSTIDLAIEQHYLDILQLKHQRNAICRINQALPSELLEEVFQHYIGSMCRADHKPLHDRHEALNEPYAWIRICHVCHSWRGIALASPRIWSRIVVTDTTKYECIREMLSRSQQAPLVVKVHAKVDAVCMSRSVQAILAQMHRICSMDLRIVGISLLDHIQAIECNAPLLRELSMSAGLNSGLSVAAVPLPTGTVNLERQVLSGYKIEQIRHSIYPSIRNLSLSISPPYSSELLPAVLKETTLLETLRLRLPGHPSTQPLDTPPTEISALPHLKHLELRGGATVCSLFLHHTTFPSSASILVIGIAGGQSGHVMTPAEFSHFVSTVVDKLNGVSTLGTPEHLRSLAVRNSASEGMDLVIRGWTAKHPVESLESEPIPYKFSIEFFVGCSTTQLAEFCSALRLSQVSSLYIARQSIYLKCLDWVKAFKHMHSLTQLLVVGSLSGETLPELLMLQQDGKTMKHRLPSRRLRRTAPWKPILPRLERLVLHDVVFKKYPWKYDGNAMPLAKLEQALKGRKKRNMTLPRLKLIRAVNFAPQDVSILRTAVKWLEWDYAEIKIDGHGNDPEITGNHGMQENNLGADEWATNAEQTEGHFNTF